MYIVLWARPGYSCKEKGEQRGRPFKMVINVRICNYNWWERQECQLVGFYRVLPHHVSQSHIMHIDVNTLDSVYRDSFKVSSTNRERAHCKQGRRCWSRKKWLNRIYVLKFYTFRRTHIIRLKCSHKYSDSQHKKIIQ